MRRLFAVLFGVMIGGGLVFIAFEFHVVRTKETFYLVPKKQSGLADSYADIRSWKPAQWKEHSELAQNLTASGRGHLIGDSLTDGLFQDFLAPLWDDSSNSKKNWWSFGGD